MKYKFKIQTFSSDYPDKFVVFYKKKSFFSQWNKLQEVISFTIVHFEPRIISLFFKSIEQAEIFVKNNFKCDQDLIEYNSNNQAEYSKQLDIYKKNSKIQTKYL